MQNGDALNVNQLQNSMEFDSKSAAGSSGSHHAMPSKWSEDETANINAKNNIEITRNGKNIDIATSDDPAIFQRFARRGADVPTLL